MQAPAEPSLGQLLQPPASNQHHLSSGAGSSDISQREACTAIPSAPTIPLVTLDVASGGAGSTPKVEARSRIVWNETWSGSWKQEGAVTPLASQLDHEVGPPRGALLGAVPMTDSWHAMAGAARVNLEQDDCPFRNLSPIVSEGGSGDDEAVMHEQLLDPAVGQPLAQTSGLVQVRRRSLVVLKCEGENHGVFVYSRS